jgi:phytanoyl-CoA hydroxylase
MTTAVAARRETLSPEQIEQFHEDGYLVIRGMFSPQEVSELRDTFMRLHAEAPIGDYYKHATVEEAAGDPLKLYPRVMHPHRFNDLSMRWMLDPRIAAALTDLFGEEPLAAQSMFYFKPPGARGQDLHQDNFYLRVKPGTCMAAWLAIDDADEGNGGMMCVPETSRLAIACPEQADPKLFFTTEHVEPPPGLEPRMMRLKAGDVLFFNGSVIHGSTPNTSADRFRRSLIFHYVPASTAEISNWYEVYDFDGIRQDVATNQDGGPCGTLQELPASPH